MDRLLNFVRGLKNYKTGDLKHFHKDELDQACFDHFAVYSDSKDLAEKNFRQDFDREKKNQKNCK